MTPWNNFSTCTDSLTPKPKSSSSPEKLEWQMSIAESSNASFQFHCKRGSVSAALSWHGTNTQYPKMMVISTVPHQQPATADKCVQLQIYDESLWFAKLSTRINAPNIRALICVPWNWQGAHLLRSSNSTRQSLCSGKHILKMECLY